METNTFKWAVGMPVGLALVLVIAYAVLNADTCQKCKKKKAMTPTGVKKGVGVFSYGKREIKCKYCGYTLWEPISGEN